MLRVILSCAAAAATLAACTTIGTHRPAEEDWAWLVEQNMTNDQALIYAYSPVQFWTIGTAELNDSIPTQSGAVINRSSKCDNTGLLTAFKWITEQAGEAAQNMWSGAKSWREPPDITARETLILKGHHETQD